MRDAVLMLSMIATLADQLDQDSTEVRSRVWVGGWVWVYLLLAENEYNRNVIVWRLN